MRNAWVIISTAYAGDACYSAPHCLAVLGGAARRGQKPQHSVHDALLPRRTREVSRAWRTAVGLGVEPGGNAWLFNQREKKRVDFTPQQFEEHGRRLRA